MDNKTSTNKPANPAPPLNALKNPEVNKETKKEEPVRYRSVYDEIAQRRKREKHKIGISSSESREEISYRFGDDISDIIDEVKQNKKADNDDDVKVYTPEHHLPLNSAEKSRSVSIPQFPEEIYSDDDEEPNFDDEDNYDVIPVPDKPRRTGMWVALISALSALCLIAAGAYGAVNGYFDGIISML